MENTQVGPFLIVKKLGTSRRQKVYHARQTEQDRDVALKFISIPPTTPWSKALDKIQREVTELQRIHHPNLVEVFGAGVYNETIFFATELVEGESLATILARRGKLTIDLVVEYGKQIAKVLRYLHANDLIHSKLTPDKILVADNHLIKVSDLRLNRSKRRRWDATKRRELDLAAYMAPEQFTEGATAKSDFYALGVILYEMLTGKLPYPPETIGQMTRMKMNSPVPSVASEMISCPVWLDKIVSQMLSPNPRHRPHSARAIVLGFEEIKNIDSTKQAAVSQIAGNFSALNAGKDKSEARRLLGITKRKPKKEHDAPFYQRIPFQASALFVICILVLLLIWPKSDQSVIQEARALIASNDSDLWSDARIDLKRIIDRQGKYAAEAENLYFISRQKTLVAHAEMGVSNRLQSAEVRLFGDAVSLEQNGDFAQASKLFSQLTDQVDPEGKQRHVFREAERRLSEIDPSFHPAFPSEIPKLIDIIADASNATSPKQLLVAHEQLVKITTLYAGVDHYNSVVDLATEQLMIVKEKIETQSTTPTSEPSVR